MAEDPKCPLPQDQVHYAPSPRCAIPRPPSKEPLPLDDQLGALLVEARRQALKDPSPGAKLEDPPPLVEDSAPTTGLPMPTTGLPMPGADYQDFFIAEDVPLVLSSASQSTKYARAFRNRERLLNKAADLFEGRGPFTHEGRVRTQFAVYLLIKAERILSLRETSIVLPLVPSRTS